MSHNAKLLEEQESEALDNFLSQLDEWTPTIPDEVIDHYLRRTGFDTSDVRLKRLVSLSVQKFISEITNDCMQQSKARMNKEKKSEGAKKITLTMEDLVEALKKYGVDIHKPDYFGSE